MKPGPLWWSAGLGTRAVPGATAVPFVSQSAKPRSGRYRSGGGALYTENGTQYPGQVYSEVNTRLTIDASGISEADISQARRRQRARRRWRFSRRSINSASFLLACRFGGVSAFPWPGNYGPRWGDPGAVMLACRKLGDLQQTKHYYPSIPSGSCYCAPMICVLVPQGRAARWPRLSRNDQRHRHHECDDPDES